MPFPRRESLLNSAIFNSLLFACNCLEMTSLIYNIQYIVFNNRYNYCADKFLFNTAYDYLLIYTLD